MCGGGGGGSGGMGGAGDSTVNLWRLIVFWGVNGGGGGRRRRSRSTEQGEDNSLSDTLYHPYRYFHQDTVANSIVIL